MLIQSLALKNFRNIKNLSLRLEPGLNFFVGNNGEGKTNLLESIYILCFGQTFRYAESDSLTTFGERACKISGRFQIRNLDYEANLTLIDGKKQEFLNGKKRTWLDVSLPAVLFSPESLAAIKEGPEDRRLLIDSAIAVQEPKFARVLRDYQRALRSRNRLLKKLQTGGPGRNEDLMSLESLTQIFLLLGTHLTQSRITLLRELKADLQTALEQIAGGSIGEISVDYVVSSNSAMDFTEQDIFDTMSRRHRELAPRELMVGTSLVGPHKHDIRFLIDQKDSRFYASQGQQRTLILALKIAQIVLYRRQTGQFPLLLLDDVMSELDASKRRSLLRILSETSAQIIMTSTDLTWSEAFNFDRNRVLRVENGNIQQLKTNQQVRSESL